MCIMTIITVPLMDRVGRRTLHLLRLVGMYTFNILITMTLVLTVSGCSGQISATIMLLAEWGPSCVYIMRPLMGRTGRRTLHLLGLGGKFVFSSFITITLAMMVSGCSGQISATIILLAEWGPSCLYIMRPLMARTGRNTLHLLGLGGKSVFSSFITITLAMMVSGGSVQISATVILLAELAPSCV